MLNKGTPPNLMYPALQQSSNCINNAMLAVRISTKMEAFVRFLDGEPVEEYGDKGTVVLFALRHAIQIGVHEALRRRQPGIPIDVFRFLKFDAFHILVYQLRPALTAELLPVDNAHFEFIYDVCHRLICAFFITEHHYTNLISNSQISSSLQNLAHDIDKGEGPATENDDRIIKISQQLLSCFRQYLADIKTEEELAQRAERTLILTSLNTQEKLDGDLLDPDKWQNAWNWPYVGKALDALETKLQVNAHAIRNDVNKEQMSRIIPVVQASGTGKSRLSEEYVPSLPF